MKKILTLVLVLVFCLLPLSACAQPEQGEATPFSLYAPAAKKLREASNYEKQITMIITPTGAKENERLISNTEIKSNGKDYYLDLDFTFPPNAETGVSDSFKSIFTYVNEYLYYHSPSGNYMGDCSEELCHSFIAAVANAFYPANSSLPTFTEDDLVGVKLEQKSDGGYQFTVSVIGDKVAYLMSSFEATSENIAFKNAKITLQFDKDRNPTSMQANFDVFVEGNNTGSYAFDIRYSNIDGSPAIAPPADTSDYEVTDFESMVTE